MLHKDAIYLPDASTGRLDKNDTKKYFSKFGVGLFFFTLAVGVSATIISVIIMFINEDLLYSSLVSNIISAVSIYCIAFPVLLICTRKLPRMSPQKKKLGAKNLMASICVLFTFTILGNIISNILQSFIFTVNPDSGMENPVNDMVEGGTFFVNIIFIAVLAPIMEELIFRKAICDRLLPMGEGYAVIVSGLVFGAVHGNFFQFFYCALNGFLWGYVYIKTGRIRYSVLGHMVMNFVGGVLISFVMSKLDMELLMGEATVDVILQQLPAYLAYLGIILFEYGCAIAGFVILVYSFSKKKIKFERGILPPKGESPIAEAFGNVGMILAVVIIGFELVGSVF